MLASELQIFRENHSKVKSNQSPDLFQYLLQPHFLFNSLNNLYALSVTGSEKTTDAIANLSQLLEKVVILSGQQVVPLREEVQLIKDFIKLERTWLGECAFLMDFRIKGDLDSVTIPPLTIYTLVENAFKHGIRRCAGQHAWITIQILVKNGRIICKIRNSCPSESLTASEEGIKSTGIGLKTITRILDNFYRKRYVLDSKQVNNVFIADLLIEGAPQTRNNAA
jgi:LytS/YehU family sensor histidine kinase